MKKRIFFVFMVLAGCAGVRPWTVPTDLQQGDIEVIVGEASRHNALGELLRTAEESLLDTDEERMAKLLRAALATGKLSEAETVTAEYFLHDVCEKNAPGSVASDFRFATPEAPDNSLHTFRQGEELLMVLYDPNCPHCSEVIAELSGIPTLPTVLAVCVESTPKLWEQTRDELPAGWIKAYDLSGVLSENLYNIRQFPSIYLLDGERRVILKNPQPCQLRK